jgi:hypothetical protein
VGERVKESKRVSVCVRESVWVCVRQGRPQGVWGAQRSSRLPSRKSSLFETPPKLQTVFQDTSKRHPDFFEMPRRVLYVSEMPREVA